MLLRDNTFFRRFDPRLLDDIGRHLLEETRDLVVPSSSLLLGLKGCNGFVSDLAVGLFGRLKFTLLLPLLDLFLIVSNQEVDGLLVGDLLSNMEGLAVDFLGVGDLVDLGLYMEAFDHLLIGHHYVVVVISVFFSQ